MENIIHTFKEGNLFETTTELFKYLNIHTPTFEEQAFLPQDFLKDLYNPEKHKAINEIYLIGIVTDEVFNGKSLAEVDNQLSNDYQGLIITAVDLKDKTANRTELSTLTRLFNHRFKAMPVVVLFRYGKHIALANTERTQYKQTFREGEKIGKVSILKDIDTLNPHRGHLDILEALKIPSKIKTFKDLYTHWQEVFNVSTLNKKFYNELFAWYQWVISEEVGVTYPNDTQTDQDDRVQLEEQIIRLITRVLFVWFIKQKQLVPNELFEENSLNQLLKDFNPTSLSEGIYYNAILQNLFFATLNKKVTERAFAKAKNTRDVKTLYRYEEMFNCSEEEIIKLFAPIPFLNGGLFECLDKDKGNDGVRYHLDGFSRNDHRSTTNGHYTHRAFVPNAVFFDKEKGLFPLLNRYHFTIEENTPNEIQVALDPELLGNVFENLLGAFNPETKESVRKQSGSFYTPKEIVNYMVDESLKAYLKRQIPSINTEQLDNFFEETDLSMEWLSQPNLCQKVAEALKKIKILDPACGSGAFPMGVLSRMVFLLEKLDLSNKKSLYELKLHLIQNCIYGVDIQNIATQISKLRFFISLIVEQKESNNDAEDNYGVHTLPNLETKFVTANALIGLEKEHTSLFSDEKLSLLKEQLFNLRTEHFYAKNANRKRELRIKDASLCREIQKYLLDNAIKPNLDYITFLRKNIEKLTLEREKYQGEKWEDITIQLNLFEEATPQKIEVNQGKRKEIDRKIKDLEFSIEKEYLKQESDTLKKELKALASWNPYDQNTSASFFDPEWMFGISDGFDIVIGNPPYFSLTTDSPEKDKRTGTPIKHNTLYEKQNYKTFARTGDIYCLFYEKAYQLLKQGGICNFITSNKWMRTSYGQATRKFFLEHTNPLILIDFPGIKVFETATVDVNILLYVKEKPTFNTWGCTIKDNKLKKLSLYVRQHGEKITFSSDESWVILSEIEQRIKAKIEAIGTPLKEWNVNIYRGILTGYNDAFIIDKAKKEEILANCQSEEERKKTDELIRPILRGRDIKRYGYDFADLYLINTHNGVKEKGIKRIHIEDYPAVKAHLDLYYPQLEKRADQGDTPYNLRNCAYIEDFFKQVLAWQRITKGNQFCLTKAGMVILDSMAFISGIEPYKYWLLALLNSKLVYVWIKWNVHEYGDAGFRLSNQYVQEIPIILPKQDIERTIITLLNQKKYTEIDTLIYKLYNLSEEEIIFIEST